MMPVLCICARILRPQNDSVMNNYGQILIINKNIKQSAADWAALCYYHIYAGKRSDLADKKSISL